MVNEAKISSSFSASHPAWNSTTAASTPRAPQSHHVIVALDIREIRERLEAEERSMGTRSKARNFGPYVAEHLDGANP